MANFLITGAGRGLGLALVQQLAGHPPELVGMIFAAFRGDSPSLSEVVQKSAGRVVSVKLDVTNHASIEQAAVEVEAKLGGEGLDVLINNAAYFGFVPDGVWTMNDLDLSFNVNALGPHHVTRTFLPLLRKGRSKKIVNLTSELGSITDAAKAAFVPVPSYKISKAALNALTRQYALDLDKEGFVVFALSPGRLQTDLGGADAPVPVETGAQAVLNFTFKAGKEHNGTFPTVLVKGMENAQPYPYDGKDNAW